MFQEAIRLVEIPVLGVGQLLSCWPGMFSKQYMAVYIAVGFSLELDDKTLILKTPHTLVVEHGEIKLEWS